LDKEALGDSTSSLLVALLGNLPRAFFVLLPVVALLLKLFYWRQGYYLDHLIFALYHHAFSFVALTFLVILGRPWVPDWLSTPLVLILWLFVSLPIACAGGTLWWF
jgi:hypothetical protein